LAEDLPIAHGKSIFRNLLTWTLYPALVLLPFAWLTTNFDRENTGLLIGFAFISLLSTGVLEWIHPYVRNWQRSHGDVLTDIAHQFLTSFFAQFLRVFLVVGFFC
jgi:hypothetical protein